MLSDLSESLGITLVCAHVNHALRADSDEDEQFCRELSRTLGWPFVATKSDIVSEARRRQLSLEDAGRQARYAFFRTSALAHGCGRVAVGHTRNDQAETFLHRLVRGAGVTGLASVHPVLPALPTAAADPRERPANEPSLIRPLLDVGRSDILEYLRAHGLDYRIDPTNRDPRFTRNRLRHELLPQMASRHNPRIVETLAATADLVRDEDDFVRSVARTALDESTIDVNEASWVLSVETMAAQHPAIARRVIRMAVERLLCGGRDLGRRHVEHVLELLQRGKSGRELHLPSLTVARDFNELRLTRHDAGAGRDRRLGRQKGYNKYEYRVRIPARLSVREAKGTLQVHLLRSAHPPVGPGSAAAGNSVVVAVEDELSELTLRSVMPSDRFRPLGAPGMKSVARYLMEQRVAKRKRHHVPVLTRTDGEILWVVGHSISETARLSDGMRTLELDWKSE